MNMKVRKSVIAFLMATTMVGSTAVPATAGTATVDVCIKATGVTGDKQDDIEYILPLKKGVTITKTGDVTAMDVLMEVAGQGDLPDQTRVVDNETRVYHRQGLLEWYESKWGKYISAVRVEGHSNTNRYFGNNGSESSAPIAKYNGKSRGNYFKLDNVSATETNPKYIGGTKDCTWNNQVHYENYLSEKDYNDYSGWMTIIDGSTLNNGVNTVLSGTHTLCLDYTMMTSLDQGFDSYVKNLNSDQWVAVPAWE